jgi:hypothetical protein
MRVLDFSITLTYLTQNLRRKISESNPVHISGLLFQILACARQRLSDGWEEGFFIWAEPLARATLTVIYLPGYRVKIFLNKSALCIDK